jgi:hypothetical protein
MPAIHMVLEPSDIQSIADAFDLGDVAAVQPTAKVYHLTSRRGLFALRCFDAGVTRTHIQATQMVRLALAAAGFSVGAPISTPAGTRLSSYRL